MQVFQPPGRKRAVFFVKFCSGAERDGRETGFLMGTWLPPAEFRAIVCGKMSEGKMNRTNGRNVPDPALSPSRALFRRLAAQDGEFEPPELFQQLFRRFRGEAADPFFERFFTGFRFPPTKPTVTGRSLRNFSVCSRRLPPAAGRTAVSTLRRESPPQWRKKDWLSV